MGFGGALLAMSAVSAISQIGQGKAQRAESNFNATLYDNQASLIEEKKQIDYGQFNRLKGKTLSTSVASVAASGIGLSGSPMAVMLDAQTQINIDQAISSFNIEQEKNYAKAQADQQRRLGKAQQSAANTNAFTTLLSGASNYAMYKGGFDNPLKKSPRYEGVLG